MGHQGRADHCARYGDTHMSAKLPPSSGILELKAQNSEDGMAPIFFNYLCHM